PGPGRLPFLGARDRGRPERTVPAAPQPGRKTVMNRRPISRRAALRGMGAVVALPFLEAMLPARTPATSPPLRLAFVYTPNGKHTADWTPRAEGAGFDLPPTLEPLRAVRDDLLVLSGLSLRKADGNGDGPGDHARAMATFLTGCQARKTDGADLR